MPSDTPTRSPWARCALAIGPRVTLEAMQLALPGINSNYLVKMAAALRFYQQVVTLIPVAGPRWASESHVLFT